MTAAPAPTTDSVSPTRVPVVGVLVFVALACGLAWLVCLPLWTSQQGLGLPHARLLLELMMFTPLVSALIVVFAIQRPRRRAEYLGLWPLRPLKRTIWMSVIAIFGVPVIITAGVLLAAALAQADLDLRHFSGYAAVLRAKGAASVPAHLGLLVAVQLLIIPFGAVVNGLATIGEELGWRGWLLPSLRPLGTWPALLITGAIWGLWHSPVILLGYDFNQPNWMGVGLTIIASMIMGTLVGWLRLRTASL